MNKLKSAWILSLLFLPLAGCSSSEKNTIGFHYYYDDSTKTCLIGARPGFNLEHAKIEEYFLREDENGNEIKYAITGIYISDNDQDYFLKDNSFIQTLEIENSFITTLPYDIFRNSSLKEIDLSKATNLQYIGDHVFESSALKKITLPPNLLQTYKGVFASSQVESVTFPNTYEKMDIDTFFNCAHLKEVNFGESIKEISGSCFEKASSLSKVLAPNVDTIDSYAFKDTENLKEFSFEFVKNIGDYAFYRSGISTVNLKDCVLGSHVFRESKVTTASLENVEKLPYKTFGDCENLTSVVLKGKVDQIGPSAFKNTAIEKIDLPNSVTFIGSEAFSSNRKLCQVNLSSSLESISTDAFYSCEALNEVQFPTSLKRIRDGAFLKTGLKTVQLPKSVELYGKCFEDNCIIERI